MASDTLTRTEKRTTTDEGAIRALINNRVEAIRDKDIDRLMADHAPDMLLFDALNPLQYSGSGAARKRTEEWFSWYEGPIGYEVHDLNVAAGEDVAFCHFLYHVSGTMTNGTQVDMWVRSTVCFRKIDGKWMATHEHDSVPFDAETGNASLDLKP